MTDPEDIAASITAQLAQKDRSDLEQLGRAQTPGVTMTDPDFEQIAIGLVMRAGENNDVPRGTWHVTANSIAEQLRQVWNARGAADLEAMDREHMASGYTGQFALEQAIKALDR